MKMFGGPAIMFLRASLWFSTGMCGEKWKCFELACRPISDEELTATERSVLGTSRGCACSPFNVKMFSQLIIRGKDRVGGF